jgi:hypothetical protein
VRKEGVVGSESLDLQVDRILFRRRTDFISQNVTQAGGTLVKVDKRGDVLDLANRALEINRSWLFMMLEGQIISLSVNFFRYWPAVHIPAVTDRASAVFDRCQRSRGGKLLCWRCLGTDVGRWDPFALLDRQFMN